MLDDRVRDGRLGGFVCGEPGVGRQERLREETGLSGEEGLFLGDDRRRGCWG